MAMLIQRLIKHWVTFWDGLASWQIIQSGQQYWFGFLLFFSPHFEFVIAIGTAEWPQFTPFVPITVLAWISQPTVPSIPLWYWNVSASFCLLVQHFKDGNCFNHLCLCNCVRVCVDRLYRYMYTCMLIVIYRSYVCACLDQAEVRFFWDLGEKICLWKDFHYSNFLGRGRGGGECWLGAQVFLKVYSVLFPTNTPVTWSLNLGLCGGSNFQALVGCIFWSYLLGLLWLFESSLLPLNVLVKCANFNWALIQAHQSWWLWLPLCSAWMCCVNHWCGARHVYDTVVLCCVICQHIYVHPTWICM